MIRLSLLLASLGMVAASLVAPTFVAPAFAQIGPSLGGVGSYGGAGLGGSRSGLPAREKDDDQGDAKSKAEKPAEPPPSIPGAQPDPDAVVIPSDKVAAEMSPNDALFDSITRGDLAAAKDAMNRGAQLDARNVLGQTPTDAAIDLNRNDITFLLLSMRGSVASTRPGSHAGGAPERRPAVLVHATRKAVPRAPRVADRGVPKPEVGFTGF